MATNIVNPLDREFIRLLTDFGFKRVFGTKERSGILLRFLNALFEGEMVIKSVEFRDKEILPDLPSGKKVLYDIYCTTDTGHHFIVEMQQEESQNFSDRILFYISRAIVDQGIRGIEYELCPVYCVVITDFNLSNMSPSLIKDIILTDRISKEIYSENMRIIFASLRQIPEDWDECDTELKRLLYLIKNMENMTRESKPYLSRKYEDLFDASSITLLTNEEAVAYSNSYFKEVDKMNAVRFAENRGRKEGMKEGRLKGREEALNEKREQARLMGLSEDIIKTLFG